MERQLLEDPNPVAERERQAATLLSVVIEGVDESANGNLEVACLTCVINRKQFACLPCYHVDMCGSCVRILRLGIRDNIGQLVANIVCPRCRAVLTDYVRVFI